MKREFGIDALQDTICLVDVPQSDAFGHRSIEELPFLFLQDVLSNTFLAAPAATVQFALDLQTESWLTHPLRAQCTDDEICIPYGLFFDAAAWKGKGVGTRDSIESGPKRSRASVRASVVL